MKANAKASYSRVLKMVRGLSDAERRILFEELQQDDSDASAKQTSEATRKKSALVKLRKLAGQREKGESPFDDRQAVEWIREGRDER